MKSFNFLLNLSVMTDKARKLRADEDARQKSVQFGVTSIIFSIISAGFFALGMFLVKLVLENDSMVLMVLFGFFGGACVVGALGTLFGAIFRLVLQYSLNRRPITWIALAALIIAVAVMAVACVLIF